MTHSVLGKTPATIPAVATWQDADRGVATASVAGAIGLAELAPFTDELLERLSDLTVLGVIIDLRGARVEADAMVLPEVAKSPELETFLKPVAFVVTSEVEADVERWIAGLLNLGLPRRSFLSMAAADSWVRSRLPSA